MNRTTTTLLAYQAKVQEFACYPKEQALAYLTLGLGNELGEFAEGFLSNQLNITTQSDSKVLSAIIKELGDVFWYVVMLANEAAIPLSTLEYSTEFFIDTKDRRINDCFLCCASLAGIVKKKIRDGAFDEILFREHLKELLGLLLCVIIDIGEITNRDFSLTGKTRLETICDINYEKLASRAKRNMIKGNGDNR